MIQHDSHNVRFELALDSFCNSGCLPVLKRYVSAVLGRFLQIATRPDAPPARAIASEIVAEHC